MAISSDLCSNELSQFNFFGRVTLSLDGFGIIHFTIPKKTVTTTTIIKTMAIALLQHEMFALIFLRLETASNKIHEFIVDANGFHPRSLYAPMPFAFVWNAQLICCLFWFSIHFGPKTAIVGVDLSCVTCTRVCYLLLMFYHCKNTSRKWIFL